MASHQSIRDMIQELETLGRNLTAWEIRFLEEISDQWNNTGQLSPEQVDKLEEIYEDRVR